MKKKKTAKSKKKQKKYILLASIIISSVLISYSGLVYGVSADAIQTWDPLRTTAIEYAFTGLREYVSSASTGYTGASLPTAGIPAGTIEMNDTAKGVSDMDVADNTPDTADYSAYTEPVPDVSDSDAAFNSDLSMMDDAGSYDNASYNPDEPDNTDESDSTDNADSTEELPLAFTDVDDEYFNDALFVGDSRMVGLSQYCEEIDSRADFYVKKALTIYNLLDGKAIESFDKTQKTLWEVLSEKQYGKIYIMVGINEIGTGTPAYFADAYSQVVDRIHSIQPDAFIYINAIMHVTGSKSSADPLYNNENINARNEAIKPLADNIHIFYMDVNEAVDDENGDLRADLSFDDVHLKGSRYGPWYEYLLSHGIK